MGASHWTRVDVRDMDRGTTWLYVGLLTVVSVAGFVARLPLRRRPPSWWRVLLEIAGSVVVNAAAVWTVRFVGWYQRAYGDDKERWRQDAMAWFGRFGAARGAACKLPEPDGAP